MSEPFTNHTPIEGELTYRRGRKPKDPRFGLFAPVEILVDGRIVGVLSPPRPREQTDWCIRLVVRDRTEQGWHWTELLSRFAEEKHARFSVTQADAMLRRRYDLLQLDHVGL